MRWQRHRHAEPSPRVEIAVACVVIHAPVRASRGIMPRCAGTWVGCQRRTRRIIARRDPMQTPGAVEHGPDTPQQGPRVWLDMDQAALDAAYTQSVWAPNRAQLVARHRSN